jgi:chromosome segregation ATPase
MTEMIEKIDTNKLMELVIDKHNKFIGIFKEEYSGLDEKLNAINKQSQELKKEIEANETKITVLNEKYFLYFHQAKKQRDELFNIVLEKMRYANAANTNDVVRVSSRIEEFEKKLQISRNIDDEDKAIVEIKKLLFDFESEVRKSGFIVTSKTIEDTLNEANASHKELISIMDKPNHDIGSVKEFEKQIGEIEGRHNWLKRRIESHSDALSYWEKQKGGIKVE